MDSLSSGLVVEVWLDPNAWAPRCEAPIPPGPYDPGMHPVRAGLAEMLENGPLVMSGAVGTELRHRGCPTPLPLWSTAPLIDEPEAVRALHRDYVKAGAQIITASTFRVDRVTLSKVGQAARTRELSKRAVALARQGVADARPAEPVLVAGSIAPVEDCYRPDLVPDEQTLRIEHGVKVGHLVSARASFALIETMNTAREARVALEAAAAGLIPAMVAFVCTPGGRLLSGEPIAEAVKAVEPLEPMAILVNCCAPDVATEALTALRDATTLPHRRLRERPWPARRPERLGLCRRRLAAPVPEACEGLACARCSARRWLLRNESEDDQGTRTSR